MGEKDIKIEMRSKLNENNIIQLIFGAAMVIAPAIMMIIYGFDMNYLFTIISGALLLIYTVRFYFVKANLIDKITNPEKDFHREVEKRLNETFIIQLIFGAVMVIAPIIMMLGIYGFDLNLLLTIISGALLIIYTIRYFNLYKTDLVNRIESSTKTSQ